MFCGKSGELSTGQRIMRHGGHWRPAAFDARLAGGLRRVRELCAGADMEGRPADWPAGEWERRVTLDVRTVDGRVRRVQCELYPAGGRQYRVVCGVRTWRTCGWLRFLRELGRLVPAVGRVSRADG